MNQDLHSRSFRLGNNLVTQKSNHLAEKIKMNKTLVFLIIDMVAFLLFAVFMSQIPLTYQIPGWSRTYGGQDEDFAFSVIQTKDGGYALAGLTDSVGAGDYDFWLVKTNSSGHMDWNKAYGLAGMDVAYSLVQTDDGGYALAGVTDGEAGVGGFWLVKTDAAGNMQWSEIYEGGCGGPMPVIQTSDGGYALAGARSFGAGNWDGWLVKTDAAGNMQWNRTYGGVGGEAAYSLVQTRDLGYAIAGDTWSLGNEDPDFWLVKTDSDGNMAWNQTYGGTGWDVAYSLVQTDDGGYALAGVTASFDGPDFWLVKTDSDGNMAWNQTYGEKGREDWAYSLVEASDGGYALTGYGGPLSAGGVDFWLVKTDAAGNMQWSKQYGGTESDTAFSVVRTDDGGYALAGYTESFGQGDGVRARDFWLVKTDARGVAPFWTQWWFWPTWSAIPLVFIGWYVIGTHKDSIFRGLRKITMLRTQERRMNLEKTVLNYIKTHKGKIRISQCAEELGIAEGEVKEALSQLQKKGLVKRGGHRAYED